MKWSLISCALLLVLYLATGHHFTAHRHPTIAVSGLAMAADWLPVLCLGLLNIGLGCFFYFSSIGSLPAQTVAVCGYLEPLSAVILSALLLHERLTPLQIAGACLIIGGALFAECVHPRRRAKKAALS